MQISQVELPYSDDADVFVLVRRELKDVPAALSRTARYSRFAGSMLHALSKYALASKILPVPISVHPIRKNHSAVRSEMGTE